MAMQIIPKSERKSAQHRSDDILLLEFTCEINRALRDKAGEVCVNIHIDTPKRVLKIVMDNIKQAGYDVERGFFTQSEGPSLRIS